jgi:hypothetical protein
MGVTRGWPLSRIMRTTSSVVVTPPKPSASTTAVPSFCHLEPVAAHNINRTVHLQIVARNLESTAGLLRRTVIFIAIPTPTTVLEIAKRPDDTAMHALVTVYRSQPVLNSASTYSTVCEANDLVRGPPTHTHFNGKAFDALMWPAATACKEVVLERVNRDLVNHVMVISITLLLLLFVTFCCRDGPATARLVTRNLLRIQHIFLLQFVNKSLYRRNLVAKVLSCSSFGDDFVQFFRRYQTHAIERTSTMGMSTRRTVQLPGESERLADRHTGLDRLRSRCARRIDN